MGEALLTRQQEFSMGRKVGTQPLQNDSSLVSELKLQAWFLFFLFKGIYACACVYKFDVYVHVCVCV